AVVPRRREEMHRLPAREHEQHGRARPHEQEDDRRDGVDLDDRLGLRVDPAARDGTRAKGAARRWRIRADARRHTRRVVRRRRLAGYGHWTPPAAATVGSATSSTMTRPTIRWWPMPQNSLHMMRKSPAVFGVTRKP